MELAKVGRKGQLSLPKSILRRLGIQGDTFVLVDNTPEGGILLRQVGVYPLEIYSDDRLKEFEEADRMTPEEAPKI